MEATTNLQEQKPKETKKEKKTLKKNQSSGEEKIRKRKLKQCSGSFRSLKRGPALCALQILLLLAVYFIVIFFFLEEEQMEIFNKFTFYFSTAILIFLFSSCLVRMLEGSSINKKIGYDKSLGKRMPNEINPTVQETYIGLYSRKCIHYWLSLAAGSFCFISIVYTLIIAGGKILINGSEAPRLSLIDFSSHWKDNISKIFTEEYELFFKDWSMKLFFGSLIMIVLNLLQYVVFNSQNNKSIAAFEAAYGREKLVNDCLLCYRLNKTNKRYKIMTFSFVCFFGCVIYIFFKRAICVVFDKSFGV